MSLTPGMGGQPHTPRSRTGCERQIARRERELGALAERQHGVAARRQLLAAGLSGRQIERRLETGRLHPLHRGVYAWGRRRLARRGYWMAAVLAHGEDAVLSHRSAAALWGLIRPRSGPIEVTSLSGRPGRTGIRLHRSRLESGERTLQAEIPVTSVSRTLVDLVGTLNETQLARAFEEADRLRLLDRHALASSCERAKRRPGVTNLRHLLEEARAPAYPRTPLEGRFLEFYRAHLAHLPEPHTNVSILDREVDAYDRARDAAFQAAGYRVVRLTHRRLEREPTVVAAELRKLLAG